MNLKRVFGIVLITGGVILIIYGFAASKSFADQVTNFFTGHFTESTLGYIIGGLLAGAAGLILLLGRFGRC
ncbi:MAG: DUF3185 family protein [Spirochaetales bacterium]|nr:DUF3185 family protein [Spirochaetales bacterium]